jgi:3-deoxy-D-manno-octulosonic-acid transferase
LKEREAERAERGAQQRRWHARSVPFAIAAYALSPLLLVYIAIRQCGRRPLVGVRAKLTGDLPSAIRHPPSAILFHGVSLGETALMRPLVPLLEQRLARPCLLTTTTETGWQGLEKSFPEHPKAFLPFDLPWAVERFLSQTRPAAVILLEAEFWPLWLCACFRRGIPVALVNARVSPRSFQRFQTLLPFIRPLFGAYASSLTQNGLYAARLRKLGARAAQPCGSLKADMIRLASLDQCQAEAARCGLTPGRPVLLLASTSPDEEHTVLAAWRAEGQQRSNWQIIICPRHPERGAELARSLGKRGVRTSQGERLSTADELLIVDEIGRLGALYGWCAAQGGIAVVGGSLGSGRGGQNMLEAAAARCATVVGWDTRSQPDAMHLLRACNGVVESSALSLAHDLAALAEDPTRRQALGVAGHSAWLAGQGAAARVLRALVRDLGPHLLPRPTAHRQLPTATP